MIVPPNPASATANVDALLAEVRALRKQLDELTSLFAVATQVRRGQITAYAGGTTLTATLDTGGTAVCRWIINSGYTPAVGHWGMVVIGASSNWWVGQDSIP